MQGFHGIHGNYNVSNVSGTFPSRNPILMGGPPGGLQQVAGSASNSRFSSNGLPDALSQVSLASQHGHSGVTNYGDSGALANIGRDGRMTNPVASFVGGTNDGRSINYGAFRNLSDTVDTSRVTAQQMTSIMENSYSAAGMPLSHNQYKASLLNDMTTHEEADFAINDFPHFGGRAPTSVSHGQIGLPRNREFSIQNEDFPALPGYKGVDTEFRMNAQYKGHTQNNISSLMQSQLPPGRSIGVNMGGANSSHALSISGTAFPPAHYQDFPLHDPENSFQDLASKKVIGHTMGIPI